MNKVKEVLGKFGLVGAEGILVIDLEGGMVSGKTTIFEAVRETFPEMHCVGELATRNLALHPLPDPLHGFPWSQPWQDNLQYDVFHGQLAVTANNLLFAAAKGYRAMFHDHGQTGGAGYTLGLTPAFCDRFGISRGELYSMSDKVVLLHSVANFDPREYERLRRSNPLRFEDIEQAQKVDRCVLGAFEGDPRVERVECTRVFEDKVHQVIQSVARFLVQHQIIPADDPRVRRNGAGN